MQHVFIYGTLRAGEINYIHRAAERHGIARPLIGWGPSMAGCMISALIRDS